MFPIRDENPTSSTAYVTVGLIVLNCLIFLFQASRPGDGGNRFTWKYGYIPAELMEGSDKFEDKMLDEGRRAQRTIARDPRTGSLVLVQPQQLPVEDATAVPAWVNIFTCMFLHGGWWHLIGNMLYLWIFGNNIEDKLGPVLFVVFYLGTGLVGNLAHTMFDPGFVPLVGASGAISGVMGAYILLFPHARILAVIPVGFYPMTVRMPAWVFLGVYILLQNLFPAFRGGGGNVALWAHIGGFVSGMALIFIFPHHKRPPVASPAHNAVDDEADWEL